jgi:endonuclease IV
MRKENTEKLGIKAKEYDVRLSVHGSYFLNFCGDALTVETSKKCLISRIAAANWMGAYEVVLHLGFLGKSHEKDLQCCVRAMNEIVEFMKSYGIVYVSLAPQTSGRIFQLGLDKILTLCEKVELTRPTIEWFSSSC